MAFPTAGIATLLARHGRSLKLTYKGANPVYNPATGTVVTDTVAPVNVKGYFYDSRKEPAFETLVSLGRRRVMFRPYDLQGNPITKPAEGDMIEGQRDKTAIVRVDEVVSGEETLVYICWVRE